MVPDGVTEKGRVAVLQALVDRDTVALCVDD